MFKREKLKKEKLKQKLEVLEERSLKEVGIALKCGRVPHVIRFWDFQNTGIPLQHD